MNPLKANVIIKKKTCRQFTTDVDTRPSRSTTVATATTPAGTGSLKTETTGNYSHGILVCVKVLCDLCFLHW